MAAPMKSMGLGHHFLRRYVWFHQQPPRFSTFPALKRQIDVRTKILFLAADNFQRDMDFTKILRFFQL